MTTDPAVHTLTRPAWSAEAVPLAGRVRRAILALLGACAVGALAALAAASGFGVVVLGLLVGVPGLVLLHRQPMAGIAVWLALAPLVVNTDRMSVRMVFWVVHRLLPLALLAVLWLRPLVVERARPLGRLRWIDAVVLAYPVVTLVSIGYTATDTFTTIMTLYDRVVAPVALYLAVRWWRPTRDEVASWVTPAVIGMLVVQLAIGLLSWVAPGALPGPWTSLAGARTTGSVRSVSVYGVTLVLGALWVLDLAVTEPRRSRRVACSALFTATALMLFLTFSRGTWLAATVALGGALVLHRRIMGRLVVALALAGAVLLGSGVLATQLDFAAERIGSEEAEESALSRLPVALASLRMFEERPLVGFGYENFNEYDRAYQGPVGGFYPDKDHSSHNLYLTLLAEQGLVGFLLYVGAAAAWLHRSLRVRRQGRLDPPPSHRTALLWLALAAHVVVNNFSNMQVSFGLGLWWLTLALIAVSVDHDPDPVPLRRSRP